MIKRISFDEPPINEVVLGRTFLPRGDFLIPYYGAFWAQLRDRFPNAEHAAPIVDPSDVLSESSFLPRVWLISKDSTSLVQLQQNRFHLNWRQTEKKNTYVRFPAVQKDCIDVWRQFEQFVLDTTGQPLHPLNAELTYTNLIEIEGASSAFEIASEVMLDWCWTKQKRFLNAPKAFAHNDTFSLPNGKDTLTVTVAAVRRKDSSSEALKLELTVKGKCQGDESFEEWSNGANDFLVQAFKDLTTTSMHKKWKLVGEK